MVFGIGRRDAREAERPPRGRVPYRLASYEHDHEGKKFKSSNVVYSFWSASKYVLILSLMLWWLPMFGQMIAGYVGGRRAGGPWKGVAASIIPVVGLYAVMTGFDSGFLPSHVFGVAIAPAAVGASLSNSVPLISPYIQFSSEYVGSFVGALAGSSPYGINTYVLTVAFAYVGGVLAAQNRREIEYTSGAVMNTTTVLVHDPTGQHAHLAQQGVEHHGVLSAMGAVFHLPGRHKDSSDESAGFIHGRHRDPWVRAADMRYADPDYDRYALPPAEATYDYPDLYEERPQRRRRVVRSDWSGRQKRRGAPNMRSRPRFSYPQYEDDRSDGRRGGRTGRSDRVQTTSDPRSIKRARKMIDKDWGHGRRTQRFVDDDVVEEEESSETEAIAVPRRAQHHRSSDQWDSI
ncbi:MAG: hypothetical protein JW880_03620 [Candidatus Thermoplasmatota archaeon]|nr:hypothetical protein [Candidatus Thermoplasmatota archaeon]